jgi:hypothetical protein
LSGMGSGTPAGDREAPIGRLEEGFAARTEKGE